MPDPHALRAYCEGCQRQIKPLSAGYVEVNLSKVADAEAERREWQREQDRKHEASGRRLVTRSAADLMTYPSEVRWHVWHAACDPDPDEEQGQYYQFTLDRVQDAAGLLHWTAHLMGKNWLDCTDWDALIGKAADGVGPLRCGVPGRVL